MAPGSSPIDTKVVVYYCGLLEVCAQSAMRILPGTRV